MSCYVPDCMGNYDFKKIAHFAKMRFIDGWDTVKMMQAAQNDREKEEIALVSLLHVSNDDVKEIELTCVYADRCKVTDCRQRLKNMIEHEIGACL